MLYVAIVLGVKVEFVREKRFWLEPDNKLSYLLPCTMDSVVRRTKRALLRLKGFSVIN